MQLPASLVDQMLSVAPVARLALLDGAQPRVLSIVFARVEGELWSRCLRISV